MCKHAWLGAAVLMWASVSKAQDATSEPPLAANEALLGRLVAERRDEHGRRCELLATARSGDLRYLACGDAGLWVVRLQPGQAAAIVEQRPTDGRATGFFVRNGALWVETTRVEAEQLGAVDADTTVQASPEPAAEPSPAAADTPEPPTGAPQPPRAAAPQATRRLADSPARSPEARRRGAGAVSHEAARVVGLEPGYAIIDRGSSHGVRTGDHVAFERTTRERVGPDDAAERRERIAVGSATTVGRRRARIALGVGERVELGAAARPTSEPLSARSFAPPRLGGLWHVGFLARPFLIIDDLGFGAAAEVRAGYRLESPLHVEAVVRPLAFGTGRAGAIGAAAAVVTASFDSRLFEVGLGIGGQTVNDPPFDLAAGSGTTIAQRVRIGAVDGGMLEVFTYVVLFHSEFEFSDIHVQGQLPVGERSWLVLHAGGGSLGMGFADIGLRVLVQGNGDTESLFLTASIGGVHLFRAEFDASGFVNIGGTEYTGPMAGFGTEWRF